MIAFVLVMALFAVCIRWTVHEVRRSGAQIPGRTSRSDAPGDDLLGSGVDPLGWSALDEVQLTRLLKDSF